MLVMTTLTMTVTPLRTLTMATTLTHTALCVPVSLEWPRATDTVGWVWPTTRTLEVKDLASTQKPTLTKVAKIT